MTTEVAMKTNEDATRDFIVAAVRISDLCHDQNSDPKDSTLQTARGLMVLLDGGTTSYPRCELQASDKSGTTATGFLNSFDRVIAGETLATETMAGAETGEKVRDDFVRHIANMVQYWSGVTDTSTGHQADGVAFSFLVALDGMGGNEMSFDVVLRPVAGMPMPAGYRNGTTLTGDFHDQYSRISSEVRAVEIRNDKSTVTLDAALDDLGLPSAGGMRDIAFYEDTFALNDAIIASIAKRMGGDVSPEAQSALYAVIERAAGMTGPRVSISSGNAVPPEMATAPACDYDIVAAAIASTGLSRIGAFGADMEFHAFANEQSEALIRDIEALMGGEPMPPLPRSILPVVVELACNCTGPETTFSDDDVDTGPQI